MSEQPLASTMAAADNASAVPARPVLFDAVPSQKDPDGLAIVSTQFNMLDARLYEHAISQARLTWGTADPSGKVLYQVKITPRECNPAIRYFSAPYNLWSGSVEYEMYIAGTGFNGGKLIIVKIPPNLDPSDYTSDDWTFFDHFLIDPKTLDGTGFTGSDQNIFNAHWNKTFDSGLGEIGGFGGTLIIGVYLPLVATAPGNSTLSLALFSKLAPDFRVGQMIPPRTVPDIPTYKDINLEQCHHPCLRGPLIYMNIPTATVRYSDTRWLVPLTATGPRPLIDIPSTSHNGTVFQFTPLNYNTVVENGFYSDGKYSNLAYTGAGKWDDTAGPDKSCAYAFLFDTKSQTTALVDYKEPDVDNVKVVPLNKESIVSFSVQKANYLGPLITREIAIAIGAGFYSTTEDLLFQMYTLEASVPLIHLRLNQKGYFTANVRTSALTIPITKTTLRCLGTIGRTQSLPKDPLTAETYFAMIELRDQKDVLIATQHRLEALIEKY